MLNFAVAATVAALTRLPLSFEANHGQTAPEARFLARGPGYTLFLTPVEALLVLRAPDGSARPSHVLRMRLMGGNRGSETVGVDELPGRVHYYGGSDPARWRSNVPTFGRVLSRGVYRGVDVVYHGRHGRLEYDFVVAPRADPRRIRLAFEGAERLRIDADGRLIVTTPAGDLIQQAPRAYQQKGATPEPVSARFALRGRQEVRIVLGPYDRSRELVIDPVLIYSTYLGGSGLDEPYAIAVDTSGDAYVAGLTTSVDFPNTFGVPGSGDDCFVSKLAGTGQALLYSTFITHAACKGIAVDRDRNAYVTGSATAGFPATAGAYQTAYGGGADAFVAKLDPAGNLLLATFMGSGRLDQGFGIALEGDMPVIAGETASQAFPTRNPFQALAGGGASDGFVAKLDASFSSLVYSSFLGGPDEDVALGVGVDDAGNAYVAGHSSSRSFPDAVPNCQTAGSSDAFVLSVDPSGALLYVTCLGGTSSDAGRAVAVSPTGEAHVAGDTYSTNFPVFGAVQPRGAGNDDAFVAKLDARGGILWSTYLGGSSLDVASAVGLDPTGSVYVAGLTFSVNFPVVQSLQPYAGLGDAFITKIEPGGRTLEYSTFLGGSGPECGPTPCSLAVDIERQAYVTGPTLSTNFPLVNPFQAANAGGFNDGFVARVH